MRFPAVWKDKGKVLSRIIAVIHATIAAFAHSSASFIGVPFFFVWFLRLLLVLLWRHAFTLFFTVAAFDFNMNDFSHA